MINATELRKGNLLNHSLKLTHPDTTLPDELVEVQAIYDDRVAYIYPNLENRVEPFEDDKAEQAAATIPLTELQPIPLTDEWLQKAGLHPENGQVVIQSIPWRWDGEVLQQNGIGITLSAEMLQYIHQLQNYYQEVVGQPLNINFNFS